MKKRIKILHVTPTYFSADSVLGGGERFVLELAKAMSHYADVRILTFGKKNETLVEGNVEIIIKKPIFYIKGNLLNPFYLNLFSEFRKAEVIHVHQIYTVLTEVSILWARLLCKSIYLTDHGGGGRTYLSRFNISKLANGILSVSEYSGQKLKSLHGNRKAIYGGVSTRQYFPLENVPKIEKKLISIGRILPHKGFHHLISAIENESLTIVGQPQDFAYMDYLKKLAGNKNIIFLHNLNDTELKAEIASASLAVFPSTNKGINGELLSGEPELLGIAPLETMAMNIPTLISNIGAYPEICFSRKEFMFEQGNVEDLKTKISHILGNQKLLKSKFAEHVKTKFTWDNAAMKCLDFYRINGSGK